MTRRHAAIIFAITSLLAPPAVDSAYAVSDCIYSGVTFSDGAISCQSGQQFRCSDGDWSALDLPCGAPPPAPAVTNPAGCSCTEQEIAACDEAGEACCVSLVGGNCTKGCCPEY